MFPLLHCHNVAAGWNSAYWKKASTLIPEDQSILPDGFGFSGSSCKNRCSAEFVEKSRGYPTRARRQLPLDK